MCRGWLKPRNLLILRLMSNITKLTFTSFYHEIRKTWGILGDRREDCDAAGVRIGDGTQQNGAVNTGKLRCDAPSDPGISDEQLKHLDPRRLVCAPG